MPGEFFAEAVELCGFGGYKRGGEDDVNVVLGFFLFEEFFYPGVAFRVKGIFGPFGKEESEVYRSYHDI